MNYPLLQNKMPTSIQKVWLKSRLFTGFIFLVIGVSGTLLIKWFLDSNDIWTWLIIAYFVLLSMMTLIYLALIPYHYQFHRYEINQEDLAFQKGYFFRSTTYVPINRIQHIETEQGPFLRKENLMKLVIHTAATQHVIDGLDAPAAQQLRQQIFDLIKVGEIDV